jgi:hypothetical protein
MAVPPEFRFIGGSRPHDPLVDGAQIGLLRYEAPLPLEWVPDQVEMKRNFPIQVSLGEPLLENSVVRVLGFCLWSARATLEIFDPVFTHGKPPLPVTVSQPLPPPALDQP